MSGSESCIYSWYIITHVSEQVRWKALKRRGGVAGRVVAEAAEALTTMSPAGGDSGGSRKGGGVFSPVLGQWLPSPSSSGI